MAEMLLGATNVNDPMHVGLRQYIVTCACRLPEDEDQPYVTQVTLTRERPVGEAFTGLIGDHKAAIVVNGGHCRCEPDREKFQALRARLESN